MLTDIEAVIFDLDGTLIDSMWMWKSIDIDYLGRHGKEFPADLQEEIEGMSFSETAVYFKNRFCLEDELDKIKADWNAMAWDKYENEVTLKEGVLEFLQYLKNHNIPAGIATSNSKELVELVLKRHNLLQYFKSIRTSCDVAKGKPEPDIYLLVAKDLGAAPKKCLVFEDLPQGIMAGKNAGMRVCAVADEFSNEKLEKKKKLADYYIETIKDIVRGEEP